MDSVYLECSRVSSSGKGKFLCAPHSGKESANAIRREGLNESRDKDSPSAKCQRGRREGG
jgi:hypothetical protein